MKPDKVGKPTLREKESSRSNLGHMVRENGLSENQFGFRKAGPQLTPSRQWWTSPQKQEEELVKIRDSAR